MKFVRKNRRQVDEKFVTAHFSNDPHPFGAYKRYLKAVHKGKIARGAFPLTPRPEPRETLIKRAQALQPRALAARKAQAAARRKKKKTR